MPKFKVTFHRTGFRIANVEVEAENQEKANAQAENLLDDNKVVFGSEINYEAEVADVIEVNIKERLEYLRGELRAERISYDELHELQSLAPHIENSDMELQEAAGIPEEEARL